MSFFSEGLKLLNLRGVKHSTECSKSLVVADGLKADGLNMSVAISVALLNRREEKKWANQNTEQSAQKVLALSSTSVSASQGPQNHSRAIFFTVKVLYHCVWFVPNGWLSSSADATERSGWSMAVRAAFFTRWNATLSHCKWRRLPRNWQLPPVTHQHRRLSETVRAKGAESNGWERCNEWIKSQQRVEMEGYREKERDFTCFSTWEEIALMLQKRQFCVSWALMERSRV